MKTKTDLEKKIEDILDFNLDQSTQKYGKRAAVIELLSLFNNEFKEIIGDDENEFVPEPNNLLHIHRNGLRREARKRAKERGL